MKYSQIAGGTTRSYALVFGAGDEAIEEIAGFAKRENVTAARFTGLGGFSQARLGYFDRAKKVYEPIAIDEQVELVSLIGDIAVKDGEASVHAHASVGHRGGSVSGGHLLMGRVWPTLELFVDVYATPLQKVTRDDLGIATIEF